MVQGRPGRGTKRQQHLRAARERKRQKREERLDREEVVVGDLPEERLDREEVVVGDLPEEPRVGVEVVDLPEELLARVGVEDDSELEESELEHSEDEDFEEEEACEVTDTEEDPVEVNTFALQTMMASSRELGLDAFEDNTTVFNYQRGAEPSVRTQYRQVQHARELEEGAKNTRTLEHYFQRSGGKQANPITLGRSTPAISSDELKKIKREAAIKSIKKKIESKKGMNGQNLMRHQAVLGFLQIQRAKKLGESREHLALQVARCFGKGIYFARRIVSWEREWLEDGAIPEGKRGCYTKTKSWFKDEGVEQAVREWLLGRSGEGTFPST
ncbi:hypothetical protein FN846DRAFT_1021166 [Sphaerosporella brunnea]|uniref:Uncharacterized protein n=1 Tax=Sphaerosporella brunnea TaxID=1250544 RepID=A0A5J5EZW7_9PEZI|nr:hypothetical protein FN846DRAFT_1021166 [Sphaerosporella brunnea]